MKCPNCGAEMKDGYFFTSKDGGFSFADEVPGVFSNAKNAKGFIMIKPVEAKGRQNIEASICEECRNILIKY